MKKIAFVLLILSELTSCSNKKLNEKLTKYSNEIEQLKIENDELEKNIINLENEIKNINEKNILRLEMGDTYLKNNQYYPPSNYSSRSLSLFIENTELDLENIEDIKLDKSIRNIIIVKDNDIEIDRIVIPPFIKKFVIDISGYNKYSYIIEKLFKENKLNEITELVSKLYDEKLSTLSYYIEYLTRNGENDKLVHIVKAGANTYFESEIGSQIDIFEAIIKQDDLENFIVLRSLDAKLSLFSIEKLLKNPPSKCCWNFIENLSQEEINTPIQVNGAHAFYTLSTYFIFYSEEQQETTKFLVDRGANINMIKEEVTTTEGGYLIKNIKIEKRDSVYKFIKTNEITKNYNNKYNSTPQLFF